MHRWITPIMLTVAALALMALPLASAGCGSSGSSGSSEAGKAEPTWQQVMTSKVSGKAPVKLNLGIHQLGTKVRLAWDLTGPQSPPVILTFRLINADNGRGFGYSVKPTDTGFKTQTGDAVTLAPITPGNFIVYFSQRFPPAEGPGYDGTITVSTLK